MQFVHFIRSCAFVCIVSRSAPAGATAQQTEEPWAQLIRSEEFSLRCIGRLAGDIELNVDPRYRAQATGFTAVLRERLEQDYKGRVFEQQGKHARAHVPKMCSELDGVLPESAEIHVAFARGGDNEITHAFLVIRTARGACREVTLRGDRSIFQCKAMPALGEVRPESFRLNVIHDKEVSKRPSRKGLSDKEIYRDKASVRIATLAGFSALSLGLRLVQFEYHPFFGVLPGAAWLAAFSMAAPTGYAAGRYWGLPSRRSAIGFALGGTALTLGGLALKPVAFLMLESNEAVAATMLLADLASVGGLAMVSAVGGARVTMRAGVSSVTIIGRF